MAGKNDSKRKKRLRAQYEQHLRVLESEKKFSQSMSRVLKALGLSGLFDDFTKHGTLFLNINRVHSVKVLVAPEEKIPYRIEKKVKEKVRQIIELQNPIMLEGNPVSLQDFLTAGLTLKNMAITPTGEKKYPDIMEVQKKLQPYIAQLSLGAPEIQKILHEIGSTVTVYFSRTGQSMYLMAPSYYTSDKDFSKMRAAFAYELKRIRPQSIKLEVNGNTRTAYRIGWPISHYSDVAWVSYKASDFDRNTCMANLPLPLYIQSHALVRLRERLSCAYNESVHVGIAISVLLKDIVTTSRKNTILIAYELLGVKVGYLVAELIDGIVLIKTFLFITNSGTPEGEKLNRELGIGKLEKEFLYIDNLAVFVASDMLQDQRVRDIFTNVGLVNVCDIEKKLQFKARAKGYAEDFLRYVPHSSTVTYDEPSGYPMSHSEKSPCTKEKLSEVII